MRRILIAALIAAGAVSGAASAQNVDQRHQMQQSRIVRGEENGTVTRREASRLETQQARITRQERRMRARHHGRLTRWDRMRLRRLERRASQHIRRARHNGQNRRY